MKKMDFDYQEFACKCKNPECNRKEQFLRVLVPIKDRVYYAMDRLDVFKAFVRSEKKTERCVIIITSGVRCTEHNRKVGGVAKSFHLYDSSKAVAFDCRVIVDDVQLSDDEVIALFKKFFGNKIKYIAPTSQKKGAVHVTLGFSNE